MRRCAAHRGVTNSIYVQARAPSLDHAGDVVKLLVYPVLFGGTVVVLLAARTAGWSYLPLVPATLVAVAAAVTILERVRPHAVRWNRDHADARVDLLHLIGNIAVGQISLVVFAAARAALPSLAVWPEHWPLWAEALVAFVIVDLGLYAVHRASHTVGWLWRLHALHHSSRRLYWINGQRRHLVHELIEGSAGLVVLLALGAPTSAYAMAVAIVTLHLMFQHANIEYRVGPLKALFAVAELHRWHHQRRWRDVQGNYGAVLAVWDYLFRSALAQRGDAPIDVGMDDEPDFPEHYLAQLAWPFRARPPA